MVEGLLKHSVQIKEYLICTIIHRIMYNSGQSFPIPRHSLTPLKVQILECFFEILSYPSMYKNLHVFQGIREWNMHFLPVFRIRIIGQDPDPDPY